MNWKLKHHNYETNYWWFKVRRDVLRIILKNIKSKHNKSVLEIGCGTGGNLKYLFNDCGEIFGLDIDNESLKIAKKYFPKAKLINHDANNLSNVNYRFELIAILDVLYSKNIKNPDLLLNQTNMLLKKNGYLLISEPAFNFLSGSHSKTVNEKRRFRKKELEDLIINSNYKIIFSNYWGITIFFILYLKRCIFDRYLFKISNSQTDLISIPIIDKILYFIMLLENRLITLIKNPFGSSIIILAKKIQT